MSPMEQLAKQEYERGYSDGKSDFFAAGVAEGEMRARQRMIANRVAANQHPFAASGKPIDHIAASGKVIAEPVKQEPVAWPVDRNWFYSVLRYAENNPDCFYEVAPDCVSLDSCDADTVINALNAAQVSAKREWVDLTDDEIDGVILECALMGKPKFARAVIAAFKEKNT